MDEVLQALVNYLESDPSLYDGDDDGALGRVMESAYKALREVNINNNNGDRT